MDIKQIVRVAEENGWRVTRARRSQHWKFIPPDKRTKPIYTSSTPSDWRTYRNLRAELRRGGLPL